MRIEFKDGELDLQLIQRGRVQYLRLVTPHKKSGTRVFVQRGVKLDSPSRLWFRIFKELYEDILNIHRNTLPGK